MILEKLLGSSDKKTFVESLSGTDKQTLLQEIKDRKTAAETDSIKLEAMKSKLEEDEKEEMKKLADLGIYSYDNLESEINKLESSLNEEILKCAEVLNNDK